MYSRVLQAMIACARKGKPNFFALLTLWTQAEMDLMINIGESVRLEGPPGLWLGIDIAGQTPKSVFE